MRSKSRIVSNSTTTPPTATRVSRASSDPIAIRAKIANDPATPKGRTHRNHPPTTESRPIPSTDRTTRSANQGEASRIGARPINSSNSSITGTNPQKPTRLQKKTQPSTKATIAKNVASASSRSPTRNRPKADSTKKLRTAQPGADRRHRTAPEPSYISCGSRNPSSCRMRVG